MLDKPFSALIGVGMFLFVGAILLESTPTARLSLTCAPVRWTGNVMGSMAALTDSEKIIERIAQGTDDFDYGCQFTLWRLIYGKDYSARQGESVQRTPIKQMDDELPAGGLSPGQVGVGGTEHVKLIDKSNKN
jgi:hypothetical protein